MIPSPISEAGGVKAKAKVGEHSVYAAHHVFLGWWDDNVGEGVHAARFNVIRTGGRTFIQVGSQM